MATGGMFLLVLSISPKDIHLIYHRTNLHRLGLASLIFLLTALGVRERENGAAGRERSVALEVVP